MNISTFNKVVAFVLRYLFTPALVVLVLWLAKTDPEYLYQGDTIVGLILLATLRGIIIKDFEDFEESDDY